MKRASALICVIGLLVSALGVLFIPLPGPGYLIIVLGLGITAIGGLAAVFALLSSRDK